MSQDLILVDVFDRAIGSGEKLEVHQAGLLHRAFSVFLVHNGEMLIQKRADQKYHSADLWANTCCSHPRVGENLESAARERLWQEAKIVCPIKEVFSFVYHCEFSNHLTEYEFDHVFLADYEGPFTCNPEEASEMKWVRFQDLAEDLQKNPQRYTVWFITAAPKVMKLAGM